MSDLDTGIKMGLISLEYFIQNLLSKRGKNCESPKFKKQRLFNHRIDQEASLSDWL